MSIGPENEAFERELEIDAEPSEEGAPYVDEEAVDEEAEEPDREEEADPVGEPDPVGEADPDVEPDPEHQLEHDLDELAAKADKADEYLLLAQRTQADFENYRKRAARDAALAQERGIAKLAKELLPAVDNLDRALHAAQAYPPGAAVASDNGTPPGGVAPADAAAGGESQLVDGLKLVHAEVLAALARVGIEPFSPVGEQFDPQHHEAVAQHQFEDRAPGTVVEVYQPGFRFGESVLRPARVLVAA